MLETWHPTASLTNLQLRAKIIKQIRLFFEARNVLEIDTPLLGHSTVTDPHLASFETALVFSNFSHTKLYLQTSPEYAMKRLLAAGVGSIYQICKAFRNGEVGKKHNPEFTILEWYRVGMTYIELMNEVETFLTKILGTSPGDRITYHALFHKYFNINPHTCSLETLKSIANRYDLTFENSQDEKDHDVWLDLLLTHLIEPNLGQKAPLFLYDYPESQAALAKTHVENGYKIGERFEVYFKGLELANGYHELGDVNEQVSRFEQDNNNRLKLGRPAIPIDFSLLKALPMLPNCAGVAMGVDRLISLAVGANHLSEVIAFPIERS